MARVSVVIPTFNRADLISETLDSVLAQTYRDFEILVINDGSTDRTLDILTRYTNKIQIINQPNQGEGAARNAGIHAARGEFVAFLDSDDLWLPAKLAEQMNLLDSTPGLDWAYTDAEVFDHVSGGCIYLYSQQFQFYQGDVLEHLLLQDFIPSPTPVIRRAVFDQVGDFWRSPNAADWDMWLRIAAGHRVGLVNQPLARYRIHPSMITARQNWQLMFDTSMTVIERAVSREPERLAPLRKRAIAFLCIATGRTLLGQGDLLMARLMFARAIQSCPSYAQSYPFLVTTLLGRKLVARLIAFNHRR